MGGISAHLGEVSVQRRLCAAPSDFNLIIPRGSPSTERETLHLMGRSH